LPDRNGTLLDPPDPEFGASKHLASTLLVLMENDPAIRAVVSIIYNENVGEGINGMGKETLMMDRRSGDLRKSIKDHDGPVPRFLIDPGDFGIEPCLYIFGTSPLEVVSLVVEIQNRMDDQSEQE
jgi:predicted fused transcriptional regulator/phosphomethylpyrimidine kinase